MTEAEWLASTEPGLMVNFLRKDSSERKLQLFAAASFRHLADLLPDHRQHRAIEILEQLGDGLATSEERATATRGARQAIPPDDWKPDEAPKDQFHLVALMLYRALNSSDAVGHAIHAAGGRADPNAEYRLQSQLVSDIFGNPFRPVTFDPDWRTTTAHQLAQGMYDSRDFSAMPILADALQDAGCENAAMLDHCRGPGTHVRGCWVVDLVLGKE